MTPPKASTAKALAVEDLARLVRALLAVRHFQAARKLFHALQAEVHALERAIELDECRGPVAD